MSVARENSTKEDLENLEFLFEKSKEYGAHMHIVYSSDAYSTITKFIKQNDVTNVITGMPVGENSVLEKLWERFPTVCFYAVDFSDEVLEVHNGKLQLIKTSKVNI
jgi:K+-sensing histidine kinase KdpD